MNNEQAMRIIKDNIASHRFHIYAVHGDSVPNYCYTIGLTNSIGFELVFAGYSYFSQDNAAIIISSISNQLLQMSTVVSLNYPVEGLGNFSLNAVDKSWSELLLLGASDYYRKPSVNAMQVVPEIKYRTIDHPDMAMEWSASAEPVWKWMKMKWPYFIPENSLAFTHLAVLQRHAVTEAKRWEEGQWEVFSGDPADISETDLRCVPLGTLLAFDPTLEPAAALKIGEGIWRKDMGEMWETW